MGKAPANGPKMFMPPSAIHSWLALWPRSRFRVASARPMATVSSALTNETTMAPAEEPRVLTEF